MEVCFKLKKKKVFLMDIIVHFSPSYLVIKKIKFVL